MQEKLKRKTEERKAKKEKGQGREEEGRRCKNRLQNRQKF